jgi:3',5'-cyclic AMP phosphodiesterase CpdA
VNHRRAPAFAALVGFVACIPLASCSSPDSQEIEAPWPPPSPLPALESAPLGTEQTLSPTHAVDMSASLDPRAADILAQMVEAGYGDTELRDGEAITTWTLDGSTPPAPGANAKMLVRFAHLADPQLTDDEAPTRVCSLDSPALTAAAFRPQEGHGCRILNAAVRTLNAVHRKTPLEFVLLGGDNIDSAHGTELDWLRGILNGAPSVECDSGKDDDPAPGPANDPKDPFFAEGLSVPWLWVTGNHDILVQGNFDIAYYEADAVGDYAAVGTRDWSAPGGPIVKGTVPADKQRALLTRTALLDELLEDEGGHGIGAVSKDLGKAYYTRDVEGTPLRVIALDTAAETGGANGIIRKGDLEGFIRPALDQAKAEGKWVILTSHHASVTLGDGSGLGAGVQPDAVPVPEWLSLVGSYDNVLMHIAGHVHRHIVIPIKPEGGHAYWELHTAAIADYPHQMRVVEVWDQDNGYLMIRGLVLDFQTEGDALAAEGRRLGVTDYTSGWTSDGRGGAVDRNVDLWVKRPGG